MAIQFLTAVLVYSFLYVVLRPLAIWLGVPARIGKAFQYWWDACYWHICPLYSVIRLRRNLIIAVVLTSVLYTALCCLVLRPVYSATCTVKVESH